MPIYSYRCEQCGHAADVLQKMSDAPLTVCPACGEPTFRKQVTAAGFQLKGSGWYVTDFRTPTGGPKKDAKPDADASAKPADDKPAADGAKGSSEPKPEAPAPTAAAAATAPAPAKSSTSPSSD